MKGAAAGVRKGGGARGGSSTASAAAAACPVSTFVSVWAMLESGLPIDLGEGMRRACLPALQAILGPEQYERYRWEPYSLVFGWLVTLLHLVGKKGLGAGLPLAACHILGPEQYEVQARRGGA